MKALSISVLPDVLGVCRLDAHAPIPSWARGDFLSATCTRDARSVSIVCAQANVPADIRCERDWRALKVEGQLDFALTGVFASIATPLADAGISIFAISTFDTDYVLVKQDKLAEAIHCLRQAGHRVES